MKLGLRVDVDTLRGTRQGVPRLLRTLDAHGLRASFFFSVGPDNMGRHVWRLRQPAFLIKMLRSRAPSLYGWDVLLRGAFWPGPRIAERAAGPIRDAAVAGHEVGLHAWDHHAWQIGVDGLSMEESGAILARGLEVLGQVVGSVPRAVAAPGWRCTESVLMAEDRLALDYASDCRGQRAFRPVVAGRELSHVQIPVTLPTFDELVGRAVSVQEYNAHLLGLVSSDRLNVLAIHAEVEGGVHAELFDAFLREARARGIEPVPLGTLLPGLDVRPGRVEQGELPGRAGKVCRLRAGEERGSRWSAA
jgi:undecaprenyl phosphate-alpha-L-ara4FN deformylase